MYIHHQPKLTRSNKKETCTHDKNVIVFCPPLWSVCCSATIKAEWGTSLKRWVKTNDLRNFHSILVGLGTTHHREWSERKKRIYCESRKIFDLECRIRKIQQFKNSKISCHSFNGKAIPKMVNFKLSEVYRARKKIVIICEQVTV